MGDLFEEDLLSGATVLKRVTRAFREGTFDSEWVSLVRPYPEDTTMYRRPGARRHGRGEKGKKK